MLGFGDHLSLKHVHLPSGISSTPYKVSLDIFNMAGDLRGIEMYCMA